MAEQELMTDETTTNNEQPSNELGTNAKQSIVQRLQQLEYQRNELVVIQQIHNWMKEYPMDNDTTSDTMLQVHCTGLTPRPRS